MTAFVIDRADDRISVGAVTTRNHSDKVFLPVIEQEGALAGLSRILISAANGGDLIEESEALRLQTDPRQWAYSAIAQLSLPPSSDGYTLVVRALVRTGHLGVGWVPAGTNEWASRASAAAKADDVELTIRIPLGAEEGTLIFDNWAEVGVSSVSSIYGVAVLGRPSQSNSVPAQTIAESPTAPLQPTHLFLTSANSVPAQTIPEPPTAPPEPICIVPISTTDEFGLTTVGSVEIEAISGGSFFSSDAGPVLTTPREQWVHSATAVLDLGHEGRRYTIFVKLEVKEGWLGVEWLWDGHRVSRASATAEHGEIELKLTVPPEATRGRLIFDNWTPGRRPAKAILRGIRLIDNTSRMFNASEYYEKGGEAERLGSTAAAIKLYSHALRDDPGHLMARARIGELRFKQPPQPFLDETKRRTAADTAEVVIEVRNPCNYRCSYCVAADTNNHPVKLLDLHAIEKAYDDIRQKCIVTSFECQGGEPTVHPQFPALVELVSRYGAVSFPSNNSQNPERWLPKANAHRILMRSALHPESEANLARYIRNARYLIDHGVEFSSIWIAHPSRMDKIPAYRDYFAKEGLPFTPVAFIGVYQGKHYPNSYSDEEKKMVGLNQESRYWLHQIEPHVTRIRNFRGIPCVAGHRSIYITSDGSLRRCMYDMDRVLDKPLTKAEPCGVGLCGCGMLLEKINSVDDIGAHNYWGGKIGLPPIDLSWMEPLAQSLGYPGAPEATSEEMRAMYDALMDAYGKDEFPE